MATARHRDPAVGQPDAFAERELGAEAPTGVARFELATGRLTAVSSAVELHAIEFQLSRCGRQPTTLKV